MNIENKTLGKRVNSSLYTFSYLKTIPSLLIGIGTFITGSNDIESHSSGTSGKFSNINYSSLFKKTNLVLEYDVTDDSFSENDFSYQLKRINLLKKIESFETLEYGWDGYNGLPIDDEVIQSTKNTLLKLKGMPQVFPTPRNSIQIEYENSSLETYMEIEVFKDKKIVYFESGEVEEEYVYKSDIDINKKIKQLNVA